MAFAATGLTLLGTPDALAPLAARLGAAANRVLGEYGDLLQAMAQRAFRRALRRQGLSADVVDELAETYRARLSLRELIRS